MTIGATNGVAQRGKGGRAGGGRTCVNGLDELVGAHPITLRMLFVAGQATDPAELGDAPRGRVLAIEDARDVSALARPIMQAIAGPLPWRGKVFHADRSGANLVLGREVAPFSYATDASDVDGEAALVLRYDAQPWPLRGLHDELRTVADGVAIGPVVLESGERRRVIGWFGLERSR